MTQPRPLRGDMQRVREQRALVARKEVRVDASLRIEILGAGLDRTANAYERLGLELTGRSEAQRFAWAGGSGRERPGAINRVLRAVPYRHRDRRR